MKEFLRVGDKFITALFQARTMDEFNAAVAAIEEAWPINQDRGIVGRWDGRQWFPRPTDW